jgi:replicative DNA helicase
MNASEKCQEIKQFLGDRAKDVIIADLGLKEQGGNITCPYPDHQDNNASASWKPHAFHCHACTDGVFKKQYDIFTHYELHHGLSIGESINKLCEEYSISNNFDERSSYKTKVIRVEKSDEYKIKQESFKNVSTDLAQSFFKQKKISESIARNVYGVHTTNNEILLHGHEVIDGSWSCVYTKRRKLDLSMYEMNGNKSKEIQIKGGLSAFYGLPSLYAQNGQEKRIALICEGQMDALRVATELDKEGLFQNVAVLSVPTGGASLLTAWNNTPFFRKWFSRCERVVIIPDADSTGKKMVEQAKECLCADKTYILDLTKITGIRFTEKHGADISDAFDKFGFSGKEIFSHAEHLPVDGLVTADNIDIKANEEGIRSGFITHDYNDSGLKFGRLTIVSGVRGHGKTTMAMQMVFCSAMQNIKSFCFFGETSEGAVVGRFARMCALDGEIEPKTTLAGRTDYLVNPIAEERFKKKYGKSITLYCKEQVKDKGNVFDEMMKRMKIAVKRGVKLFLIDNMMMICQPKADNVFQEQKRITEKLKEFALEKDVHIILIAHPRSGEGIQKISGAQEQENLADTILYYVRLPHDSDKSKITNETGINSEDAQKISAVIINKKVRDEGTAHPVYLEWQNKTGTVSEITSPRMPELTQEKSEEYFKNGWFSRPSKKYTKQDHPEVI